MVKMLEHLIQDPTKLFLYICIRLDWKVFAEVIMHTIILFIMQNYIF